MATMKTQKVLGGLSIICALSGWVVAITRNPAISLPLIITAGLWSAGAALALIGLLLYRASRSGVSVPLLGFCMNVMSFVVTWVISNLVITPH